MTQGTLEVPFHIIIALIFPQSTHYFLDKTPPFHEIRVRRRFQFIISAVNRLYFQPALGSTYNLYKFWQLYSYTY